MLLDYPCFILIDLKAQVSKFLKRLKKEVISMTSFFYVVFLTILPDEVDGIIRCLLSSKNF